MKIWRRAALVFGVTPLCVGTSVFITWIATRWDILPLIGVYTLYAGLVSVTLGFACLAIHAFMSHRRQSVGWRLCLRESILPLLLLLANFPAAFGYTFAAIAIETRYVVTVVNAAPLAAHSVVVRGGGVNVEFGTVEPGEERSRGFYVKHDGQLTIEGSLGGKPVHALVEEYVTNGQGGNATVVLNPDGRVLVKNLTGREDR